MRYRPHSAVFGWESSVSARTLGNHGRNHLDDTPRQPWMRGEQVFEKGAAETVVLLQQPCGFPAVNEVFRKELLSEQFCGKLLIPSSSWVRIMKVKRAA